MEILGQIFKRIADDKRKKVNNVLIWHYND